MRKLITTATKTAVILMLLGVARAQQPPATSSQQTPPAKSPSAPPSKAQTTPAAKRPTAAKNPAALTLSTEKDKVSYALGMNLGRNLRKDSLEIDTDILVKGVRDGLAGDKLLLTDAEAQAVLTQLQNNVRKIEQERAQAAGETNKKQGQEFLAANKSKEGVVALPSGLQYKILQQGTGPKPTPADTVVCNYRGTLIDNTEFDSSFKRGQPATFGVSQVIKGWTEALQLMPVGSKWQLFIPPDLAYGDRGAGAQIGPNATLIFEVELLSIQAKDQAKEQPKP
jgi:FKBP-type peptidyl-prolyl cis-trans isomerase FklB